MPDSSGWVWFPGSNIPGNLCFAPNHDPNALNLQFNFFPWHECLCDQNTHLEIQHIWISSLGVIQMFFGFHEAIVLVTQPPIN